MSSDVILTTPPRKCNCSVREYSRYPQLLSKSMWIAHSVILLSLFSTTTKKNRIQIYVTYSVYQRKWMWQHVKTCSVLKLKSKLKEQQKNEENAFEPCWKNWGFSRQNETSHRSQFEFCPPAAVVTSSTAESFLDFFVVVLIWFSSPFMENLFPFFWRNLTK